MNSSGTPVHSAARPRSPDKDKDNNASVYLRAYLEPFRVWMERGDVSDILVNRPGEAWIEVAGQAAMMRMPAPAIDDRLLQGLSEQVTRVGPQGAGPACPLQCASLADGSSIRLIGPRSTRGHWALAIRLHRLSSLALSAYDRPGHPGHGAGDPPPAKDSIGLDAADPLGTLRRAVAARATILISGGTSSGKTSFLNALLREVPNRERVIGVEDMPEIEFDSGNRLGLVALDGEFGQDWFTTGDLLHAALRLRPDRIVLGDLRASAAIDFLRAVLAGHPGSFATIQANSPRGALEQLALMVMQAGLGLSRADAIAYVCSAIDLVVQLDRRNGLRGIAQIATTREPGGAPARSVRGPQGGGAC